MNEQIIRALRDLEREQGVRVLLAVESGSRAWGFASPDSDYDVRFIYVHPRDWYVSVLEARDVVERMLPGDLDVSGWDLRKTLRLFAKCNLALNEWLSSPLTYLENSEFRKELASLVPRYFNAIAGVYHYRKMALSAFVDNYRDGVIGIKKIFYVLRPLLACRWIEHVSSQPPTEFNHLVAADWVSPEERQWIGALLEQKALAMEAATIALEASRASKISSELERYEAIASALPAPPKLALDDLNELLRRWTASWRLPL